MAWQFDRIEDYLWDIADYLYDVYEECSEIPLVGRAIASAVYPVYYAAFYVAYYFQRVNDWADGIVDNLEWLDNRFYLLYNAIRGFDDKIRDFLSWTDIRSRMEAYYRVLTDSYSTIVSQGKAAILGRYASLDAWFDAQKDKIEEMIVDRFERILDRIFS